LCSNLDLTPPAET